ncbi:hypothetical protein K7X08_036087 [Anisodus acutangulus]|uniref:Uncharacterized protein n=1 Tax=Anisodus acutangulus TaxID=402998 RepID=A0A9Q1L7M9_9SOLA|nr:hypothetical protein K7X08_036087 [Anisodus acutangulus]
MNKMNKEFAKPWPIGPPGLDLISLGLVDVEKLLKYELTVEDGRRLSKEYSRVLMRKHRQRQAAETTLLRLKKEAIEALPENLKAAALVPDLTPFPVNRRSLDDWKVEVFSWRLQGLLLLLWHYESII